jgi:simple sugar transport system ATP-binding protein
MSYIKMAHISKRFGTVLANDDVNLSVNRGEILALLGENGSGKSTLMNMLSGIYTPDSGSISIEGVPCCFRSPENAIAAYVGMVHQHFKLIPVMTAWENISLGEKRPGLLSYKEKTSLGEKRRGLVTTPFLPNPLIDKKRINNKITNLEQQFGLYVNHDKKLYDMSVSEQQTVEILKVLYRDARTLILDEPTAVLTPQEIASFFTMLRSMKEAGKAIIIITHKLNEVLEISDRVTVLRKGRVVGTVNTAETSARELTGVMVGESVSLEISREEPVPQRKPLLEVCSINYRNAGVSIKDMSFDLYGGEILGVAGIAGSGQRELCEIIAGLRRVESGSILLNREPIERLSPRAIKERRVFMSFVPEDRLGMGLVAGMSITDNILLRSYGKPSGIFVDRQSGRTQAEDIVRLYDISTPSISHPVRKLSGGNIQKVLLGREIEMKPQVLITAYPVRGLDIGASYNVYEMLNKQKRKGVAILFIGEDLDVLMELCDKIMVIRAGAESRIVNPRTVTKEEIGALMLGCKEQIVVFDHHPAEKKAAS